MKKSNKYAFKGINILMISILVTFFGCSKEDGLRYKTPTIDLGSAHVIDVKTGNNVRIPMTFTADNAARSVVVYKSGGFLKEILIESGATSFEYETDIIPEGMQEGDEIVYGFLINNQENVDSEMATYTLKVEMYDKVVIGTTSLYNIDIPEEGLVPAGTTIKLIKGRNYFLTNTLDFEAESTFEVQEGVHLYMDAGADDPIEINISGEANIIGTAEAPVVFTSSNTLVETEQAEAGDWGTLRINGSGGESSNGTLNYLRIEYGGEESFRAFRLSNVGSGTDIKYIQVFKSSAEGIMITDGQARLKYIVATDCEGGSYRIGEGYEGYMQFAIAVAGTYFDEVDDVAIRETAKPSIANATILGPGEDLDDDTHGFRIRAASAPKIYNTIVAQFPRRAVRVNNDDADNAVPIDPNDWDNSALFVHSHVFDIGSSAFHQKGTMFSPDTNPVFQNSTNAIGGIGVADFVPDAEQTSTFDPATINSFFTSAAFVGAVKNEAEDWTKGWVKNPDGNIR